MADERTEGYWISPALDVAKVRDHFEAIRDAPEAFGFTAQAADRWTRADREKILREAILRKWIRVREHRNYTTFEMREMNPDSGFAVKSFLAATGAWPQEMVEIHEIGPKRAWRETAGYFLEEKHLAILEGPDRSIGENGIPPDLARVVMDETYLRDQGFVPRGPPTILRIGEPVLSGKIVRSARAAGAERPLVAAFVMGLSSGFGNAESFDAELVRTESLKRFPKGGTLILQLGWSEGTREDSVRLTIENSGTGLDDPGFRKEMEGLVRAFIRKFRQRTIWLDYYRSGERLEAIAFDWKR